MANPNVGGRPSTAGGQAPPPSPPPPLPRGQMSAYWATNHHPTPHSNPSQPSYEFLQHDPAEYAARQPAVAPSPLRSHHSSSDLASHFRLARSQDPQAPTTSQRRGRKSLKLKGFGGLMKSSRREQGPDLDRELPPIPRETRASPGYEHARLVPPPLRPQPNPLSAQRSISQPTRATVVEPDEDYAYYEELARSPGFPDPGFGYDPSAAFDPNRLSYARSIDSSLEEPPAPPRKESVAPFDDADDIGLFVAATTGFNPMSPDNDEELTPHIPQPPASAPLTAPSPYREHLSDLSSPLQQSNSWHYSGPPLRQASRSTASPVPPMQFQAVPSMQLEPATPQPQDSRDWTPNLHPSQVASLQRQNVQIETPQMREAARRTNSPAGYDEVDLENVEGDDELPDYATSQREAQEASRREAARRAKELEMRWMSARR